MTNSTTDMEVFKSSEDDECFIAVNSIRVKQSEEDWTRINISLKCSELGKDDKCKRFVTCLKNFIRKYSMSNIPILAKAIYKSNKF